MGGKGKEILLLLYSLCKYTRLHVQNEVNYLLYPHFFINNLLSAFPTTSLIITFSLRAVDSKKCHSKVLRIESTIFPCEK